jgi:hypothetical protein
MKKLYLSLITAVASLALLVPVSSARAGYAIIPFCGNVGTSGVSGTSPKTLAPGQVCSFFPVAVAGMHVSWDVTKRGSGSVCLAVIKSPPGWPNGTILAGSGAPGPAACEPVNSVTRWVTWQATNGFGAVYGQPVMINYSSATIKSRPDQDGYLAYYY